MTCSSLLRRPASGPVMCQGRSYGRCRIRASYDLDECGIARRSRAAPAADTVITFDRQAEGTLISTQYASLGVTFSQPDGGRPQIDNDPFLFFYTASSGNGVLTGSTEGAVAPASCRGHRLRRPRTARVSTTATRR